MTMLKILDSKTKKTKIFAIVDFIYFDHFWMGYQNIYSLIKALINKNSKISVSLKKLSNKD